MHSFSLSGGALNGQRDSSVASFQVSHGPRLQRLHRRLAEAHPEAEAMGFLHQFLDGRATPRQIAGLIRGLAPGYRLLEALAPPIAKAFGSTAIPWPALMRSDALDHDLFCFPGSLHTPPSGFSMEWQRRIRMLAAQHPHCLLAHVYVRYGGDLLDGQGLGPYVNLSLQAAAYEPLLFWDFPYSVSLLREQFHAGFEQLQLTEQQDDEFLDEAVNACHLNQSLLVELASF